MGQLETVENTPRLVLPFNWKQGEHVSITGNTGSGKTTLANALLYARRYTVVLRSKADPAPLPGKLVRSTSEFNRSDDERLLVDPVYERQYGVFNGVMESIWKHGNICVYVDELYYMTKIRLSWQVDKLLTQGRSKNITVVCGMQRPAAISRFAMSQATHVISFGLDGRDVKNYIREATNQDFADTVSSLARFEFAWFYVPERKIWRGRVQDLLPSV